MKYRNNLSDVSENSCHRVIEPFKAYVKLGIKESNTFVGASQALGTVYAEVLLPVGTTLFDTHGGVYAELNGKRYSVKAELSEKHLFEKSYGGPPIEVWPVEKLEGPLPFRPLPEPAREGRWPLTVEGVRRVGRSDNVVLLGVNRLDQLPTTTL